MRVNVSIEVDKSVMGGEPTIAGTRILVRQLLDYMETRQLEKFYAHFPQTQDLVVWEDKR